MQNQERDGQLMAGWKVDALLMETKPGELMGGLCADDRDSFSDGAAPAWKQSNWLSLAKQTRIGG